MARYIARTIISLFVVAIVLSSHARDAFRQADPWSDVYRAGALVGAGIPEEDAN